MKCESPLSGVILKLGETAEGPTLTLNDMRAYPRPATIFGEQDVN